LKDTTFKELITLLTKLTFAIILLELSNPLTIQNYSS